MRWVSASVDGTARLGVVDGGTVCLTDEGTGPLLTLLRGGTLAEVGEAALRSPVATFELSGADLRAPLPEPSSVRDFMAFEQHVDGMSRLVDGQAHVPGVWYDQPLFYFTNPTSVIGPHDDVAIPPGAEVFDFELEVAAVIGPADPSRPLTDLSLDEADAAIAGYLLMNDWSARDLQFREMQGPLGPCKGKDSAITLGPWFVTADELEPYRKGAAFDLGMSVWVNDELIGQDRLSNMAWSFAEMAAYASRGTRLRVGDVLGSGTCGDGCLAEHWGRHGRDSLAPLRVGDVVSMEVDLLGAIANRVVAGEPVRQPLRRRPHPV